MTQKESPIFLEQVTPVGEEFMASGVAYVITVKAKSTSLTTPSMGSEQDDT
jgi:hypothetical protein